MVISECGLQRVVITEQGYYKDLLLQRVVSTGNGYYREWFTLRVLITKSDLYRVVIRESCY